MNSFLHNKKLVLGTAGLLLLALIVVVFVKHTGTTNTPSSTNNDTNIHNSSGTKANIPSSPTLSSQSTWQQYKGDGYSISLPQMWKEVSSIENGEHVTKFSPNEQEFDPIAPSLTIVTNPKPTNTVTKQQKLLEILSYSKSTISLGKISNASFEKLYQPPKIANQTYGTGMIDERAFIEKGNIQYEFVLSYSQDDTQSKSLLDAMLASINYQ